MPRSKCCGEGPNRCWEALQRNDVDIFHDSIFGEYEFYLVMESLLRCIWSCDVTVLFGPERWELLRSSSTKCPR